VNRLATRDTLDQLLALLPSVGFSDDPDEQTRAVLKPLIERAVELRLADARGNGDGLGRAIELNAGACPNCETPTASSRTPYCCVDCKETAAFVRQIRAAIADGSILNLERQMNFGQKWWSLQGGGYPRRQLMVPAKTIAKVIARDGGVCAICGAPATEIDHTGSG